MTSTAPAGSNWLALKRTLSTREEVSRPTKRRKVEKSAPHPTKVSWNGNNSASTSSQTPASGKNATGATSSSSSAVPKTIGDPDSKENLAAMILRTSPGKETAKPTKFLALDCEMVGVGPFGLESVLARVTVVNYVGDVLLDEFVLPQETVTDWRTAVSGVRKEDMVNAKSFVEVQSLVAALLKDRYLVGHALSNDLSALLLSHPWLQTRDTQGFAPFKAITRSKRPSLRKLVKEVFDITIQQGEHSSVIDARAPMALYRLYRKQWESKGAKLPLEVTVSRPLTSSTTEPPARSVSSSSTTPSTSSPIPSKVDLAKKTLTSVLPAKATKTEAGTPRTSSGPKRKKKQGISSGLSVVVTRNEKPRMAGSRQSDKAPGADRSKAAGKTKEGWWKELP